MLQNCINEANYSQQPGKQNNLETEDCLGFIATFFQQLELCAVLSPISSLLNLTNKSFACQHNTAGSTIASPLEGQGFTSPTETWACVQRWHCSRGLGDSLHSSGCLNAERHQSKVTAAHHWGPPGWKVKLHGIFLNSRTEARRL